jgi:hypothetical protein
MKREEANTMARGEDFVHVKLSAAGEKLAGSNPLRVVTGTKDFTFKAGEAQRVTRAFEWERVLSQQYRDGECLFELADASAGLPSASDLDQVAADGAAAEHTQG